MKKSLLFLFIFIALQTAVGLISGLFFKELLIPTIIINAIIVVLFLAMRWYEVDRRYIQSRPWLAIIWTVLLSIGIILPMAYLEEQIPESWRPDVAGEAIFQLLKSPEGYFAVCLLAPLAEEIVFRGAIITALRKCQLSIVSCIIISSLFFAAIHFNPAQMPHAFIMGLLLGWLFVRTDSILLCFLVHWINNSFAYVMVKLFPSLPMDAPLADYFGGSQMAVAQAILCSLMIAIPSLYQLNRILKKTYSFSNA